MKWNYDMNLCPLNTKVKLLSSDDCLLLPRREYICVSIVIKIHGNDAFLIPV